jgi:hypothetical protein
MNEFQKEKLTSTLKALTLVTVLIVLLIGLFLNQMFALIISCAGIAVCLAMGLAYCVATMVYKWRIMGVTETGEENLFERCWRYYILEDLEGRIAELEQFGEDDLEYTYLKKVAKVKKPKLL